jgi:hypothetical protein
LRGELTAESEVEALERLREVRKTESGKLKSGKNYLRTAIELA